MFVLLYNSAMHLEEQIARLLIKQKKTLSTAESCTGGLLANLLTNIPGSSKYFKLGLITYSYESKEKLLRVPRKTLRKYGAVSEPVTSLMAKNVRKALKTHFAIAITGIAGPSGATKTKPRGLTYVAVASASKLICQKHIFKGPRYSVKTQAARKGLELLLKLLS